MHAVEDTSFIHTLPDDILASIYAEIAYAIRLGACEPRDDLHSQRRVCFAPFE